MTKNEFDLELEVDSTSELRGLLAKDEAVRKGDVVFRFSPSEEGHGFGLTEIINVAVSLSGDVATAVVAELLYESVKGTIRKVKARGHRSAGGQDGLREAINRARDEPPVSADDPLRQYPEAPHKLTPPDEPTGDSFDARQG